MPEDSKVRTYSVEVEGKNKSIFYRHGIKYKCYVSFDPSSRLSTQSQPNLLLFNRIVSPAKSLNRLFKISRVRIGCVKS